MKRDREEAKEGDIHVVMPRPQDMRSPAEIHARFKMKRRMRHLQLEQGVGSREDRTVVVLCAMQTLLSPVLQVRLGNDGQVPCEGYFCVVDALQPSRPIYENGFILFPPHDTYRNTKEAVANLAQRIVLIHNVDPRSAQPLAAKWRQQMELCNDFSMSLCRSIDDVAHVMDAVISAVESRKESREATTVFVTSEANVGSVTLALQWMQGQRRMKLSGVAVKKISEIFPDLGDDNVLHEIGVGTQQDSSKEEENRCVAHPLTAVNKYGQFFECCKESCRMLHRTLCLYAQYCDDVVGDEGGGAGDGGHGGLDVGNENDDDDVPDFCKELDEQEKAGASETVIPYMAVGSSEAGCGVKRSAEEDHGHGGGEVGSDDDEVLVLAENVWEPAS